MKLLKGPLEGLTTLHAMGIIHRDVRRQNMLVLSYDPPQASLCDYGKAVEAETATDTRIGPIHTLAPKVWTTAEDGPYTAVIDTWAYGYAIAEILGYKSLEDSNITQERLASILKILTGTHGRGTGGEALVDLVSNLLVWEPQNRWSAAQALQHVCWNSIARQEDQKSDGSAEKGKGKRPLMNNSRTDLGGK